jgi:acyl dehydratase
MASDDLKPGEVFESPSRTLTDAHFLFFSGLTGDNHPIHYDVEYAKGTRFGKPLAHGLLLASLTALGASPGSSRIDGFAFVEQGTRFLKPVMVGDTIRPRLTVERVWQEGKRRFVRLATALVNQRGETVLEGFHVYQVLPPAKPSAAPAPAGG